MESFGIPTGRPSASNVDARLAAQDDLIRSLLTVIYAAVDSRLARQEQALAVPVRALANTVSGRLAAQTRRLAPVVQTIQTAVDSRLAEQQIAVGQYQAQGNRQAQAASEAAGLGGGQSLPPPAPAPAGHPSGGRSASPAYRPPVGGGPQTPGGQQQQQPGGGWFVYADPTNAYCAVAKGPGDMSAAGLTPLGGPYDQATAHAQAASISGNQGCSPTPSTGLGPGTQPEPQPRPQPPTPLPQPQPQPQPEPQPQPQPQPLPLPPPQPQPPHGHGRSAAQPLPCAVQQAALPSLPLPGSAEWCSAQADVRAFVVSLGNRLLDWIGQAMDPDTLLSQIVSATSPDDGSLIGDVAGAVGGTLLSGLAALAGPALATVQQLVSCAVAMLPKLGECDPSELIALTVVRVVLDALGDLEVGWDVALWSITRVRISFDALSRSVDYLLESACPSEVPAVPEAIECWLRGQVDESTFRCWMAMRGASADVWGPVIQARRETLTPQEWIEFARRNGLPEQDQADGLRYLGWMRPDERSARVELYDEIPTISDHLHWLQRNVFDDDYVRDFDLMSGFEDRFWAKFGNDLRVKGMRKEYAGLHYAAHWVNPAPGQLADMLRRLRPGRVDPSVVFTREMYLRTLTEQDVAPFFRQRFEALAYQPFGLRFLRQLYQTSQIDEAELAERYQDIGYNAADARLLVGSDVQLKAKQRATTGRGWTPARLSAGWQAGVVEESVVRARMREQGYTDQEATDLMEAAVAASHGQVLLSLERKAIKDTITAQVKAFQKGTLDRQAATDHLTSLGVTADGAALLLDLADGAHQFEQQAAAMKVVHQAVGRGTLNESQAAQQLIGLGIVPDRAADYARLWSAERRARSPGATVGQTLGLVRRGLLSPGDATQRLRNLGWQDPDAALLLAEAQQQLAQREAQALAGEQRQERTRAAQLARLQAQAGRQQRELQQRLRSQTPVGTLERWFVRGIVGERWMRQRLTDMGFDQPQIDKYIEESKEKKSEHDAKGAAKGHRRAPQQGGPAG